MAIKLDTTTIFRINDTAAHFRSWAVFINDLFTITGGWVDTAATGSIDLTTVAAPTLANTSSGFKVYRMADALQATAPVFVKIEYGSGSVAANPGLWFTVGTVHDGAGTLSSVVSPRTALLLQFNTAIASRCQGSADTNRICFAMWLQEFDQRQIWLSIERTKNTSGGDTGVGVIIASGLSVVGHTSSYCPFVSAPPPIVVGLHLLLSDLNFSSFDGNVGVSAMYPMGTEPKQPGLNIIAVRASDFTDFSGPIITIYGAAHSYIQCGPFIHSFRAHFSNGLISALEDTGVRLCLRYE